MSLTGGKRKNTTRKANKSLMAWVAFVKKVQKEEKLSYKEAIHRAKIRKDKGEKWMKGGIILGGNQNGGIILGGNQNGGIILGGNQNGGIILGGDGEEGPGGEGKGPNLEPEGEEVVGGGSRKRRRRRSSRKSKSKSKSKSRRSSRKSKSRR